MTVFQFLISLFLGWILFVFIIAFKMNTPENAERYEKCVKFCNQKEEPLVWTNSWGLRCHCDDGREEFFE